MVGAGTGVARHRQVNACGKAGAGMPTRAVILRMFSGRIRHFIIMTHHGHGLQEERIIIRVGIIMIIPVIVIP